MSAGTALAAVEWAASDRTPNQVLDALDISGQVVIDAPGVVIRNGRIHGTPSDAYGIYVVSGGVTVTDSEILGFANAIAFTDWTAIRVNIHSTTQDGAKLRRQRRPAGRLDPRPQAGVGCALGRCPASGRRRQRARQAQLHRLEAPRAAATGTPHCSSPRTLGQALSVP